MDEFLFWNNFTTICKERGTTPTGVIKKLNVSPSKLTLWKGGSLPKQSMLYILAEELNCTVADFFSVDHEIHEPQDADEADIITIFRSMDREDRHRFMARMYAYRDALEGKMKEKE